MYSDEESQEETAPVNYKLKYRELKKHLSSLIYENECFQDELKKAQRNFLGINRDKSYLLDRILKYEKPPNGSSDSEATESSEEEDLRFNQVATPALAAMPRKKITRRKRSEADMQNGASNQSSDSYHMPVSARVAKPTTPRAPSSHSSKPPNSKKARKPAAARKPATGVKKERKAQGSQLIPKGLNSLAERQPSDHPQLHMGRVTDFDETHKFEFASDNQMTREDIERRLEARRYSPELEFNTTAAMPAELFSHDPADQESDLDGSENCDYPQVDEDGQDGASADMVVE